MTLNDVAMLVCSAGLAVRSKDALDTVTGGGVFGDILKALPVSIKPDTCQSGARHLTITPPTQLPCAHTAPTPAAAMCSGPNLTSDQALETLS